MHCYAQQQYLQQRLQYQHNAAAAEATGISQSKEPKTVRDAECCSGSSNYMGANARDPVSCRAGSAPHSPGRHSSGTGCVHRDG